MCVVLGVATESEATQLQTSRLLFAAADDEFSRHVVLVDPGIPKQTV
jgi:hypothetical protein